MARALIIVSDGFTDSEYTYALDRCREEDIEVTVATLSGYDAIGEKGWRAKSSGWSTGGALKIARNHKHNDRLPFNGLWDILILPGGVKSIEKVRQDRDTIEIIILHHQEKKIIASICHGAQLLIEAGLCRNRLISGYYSIRKDIENAGADYTVDVTVSGNIVTASHYDQNGKWMKAAIEAWRKHGNEA